MQCGLALTMQTKIESILIDLQRRMNSHFLFYTFTIAKFTIYIYYWLLYTLSIPRSIHNE